MVNLKNSRINARDWVFLILGGFSIALLVMQVYFTRFLQDDYFLLGYISRSSWFEFMVSVWQGQGGNLWPYALQSFFLLSSITNINFTVIALWTFVTVTLVTSCNIIIFKSIMGDDYERLGKYKIVFIFALSYLGFEGLFSPGLIAAFSYHQASFSHLWPISLLIVALHGMAKQKKMLLAIPLGLLIGNANASESLFALIILSLTYVLKNKSTHLQQIFLESKNYFNFLFLSTVAGFIMIFSAPGFWNRATNSVGLPDTPSALGYRFVRSLGSFSADLLTHPMIWLSMLIGILLAVPRRTEIEVGNTILRVKILFVIGFVLFSCLTIGSTFAYVSWHQSSGLYQLFIPLSFLIGFYSNNLYQSIIFKNSRSVIYILVIISSLLLSSRAGILFVNRASNWDTAYKINYCLLQKDDKTELIGAEMLYPGFNLGIEDIASWEWMANGYSNWLSNPKFRSEIQCSAE